MTNFENIKSKYFWPLNILGLLITGTLYFFSTGLTGIGFLIWIAPIAVLMLAFNYSARSVGIVAFFAYLLGSLNLLSYLSSLAPIPIVIIALIVPSLFFSLSVLIARYFFLRFKHWLTIIAFPVAWTCFEYILFIVSGQGTFGNLAYTQTDFLPLLQIASITGLWGISFILTLVPSSIAVAWCLRESFKQTVLAILVSLSLVLSVLGWGWFHLRDNLPSPTIKVGLAATDKTVQYFRTEEAKDALGVVQTYAKFIDKLAIQGAKIIVLPEKFVGVAPNYSKELYGVLAQAAQKNNVTVVAGLNHTGKGKQRNVAVVFSPRGEIEAEYDKIHLLAGFESQYQSSNKLVVLNLEKGSAAIAICKDMDFPKPASDYGKIGAGIIFVPAWDFVKDGRLHSRMAVMRGVENGFSVVRSAQEGLLTISDSKGRIIAEDSSSRADEVLLLGEIFVGPAYTFYSSFGDWFAFLNLLLLVLSLTLAIFKANKKSNL